jgi:hypothetical protein
MKPAHGNSNSARADALKALKTAILTGATSEYERLVAGAFAAGATDEQIDATVHEAVETLFANAERPVTPRGLAHGWPNGHFRR